MNDTKCTAKKFTLALLAVLLLSAVDQVTKVLAQRFLMEKPFVLIPGVFELRYLENRGAAFSILQGAQWFFIILSTAFLIFALLFYRKVPVTKRMLPLRLCLIFLCAGALGNLIDRVMLGYVRDFLYFVLIDFPIFNVADIYVSVTAVVLGIFVLFVYHDHDFDFLKSAKEKKNG